MKSTDQPRTGPVRNLLVAGFAAVAVAAEAWYDHLAPALVGLRAAWTLGRGLRWRRSPP